MSNSVIRIIHVALLMIVFLLALANAATLFQTTSNTLDITYQTTIQLDRNLSARTVKEEMNEYSGGEILQTLYQHNEIGTDIEVDGTLYSIPLELDTTDLSSIDVTKKYSMTLQRGNDGTIQVIKFTSR